jgi:hypothetical protein
MKKTDYANHKLMTHFEQDKVMLETNDYNSKTMLIRDRVHYQDKTKDSLINNSYFLTTSVKNKNNLHNEGKKPF